PSAARLEFRRAPAAAIRSACGRGSKTRSALSMKSANCPNCGAPVQFRWSGAVQTSCPFCKSIIVRADLELKNVGQVADLPPDPSPIQLLTEGIYKGKKFQVSGRLVYEYEQGGWNEWHIVMADGQSGWL